MPQICRPGEPGGPIVADLWLVNDGVVVPFDEDWRTASLPEPKAEVRAYRCSA
jgi:hypothetical protein